MTCLEKAALETAYDYFKNPDKYPLIEKPKEEIRPIFAAALEMFIDFDENGETSGFNKDTIDKFFKIKSLKGIK